MLIISQAIASASPVNTQYQRCERAKQKYGVEPYDYTCKHSFDTFLTSPTGLHLKKFFFLFKPDALLFMGIIISLCTISMVSFFRCTYRRLKAEEELVAENILQSTVHRNNRMN